jgi:hypothetical protein
MDSLFLAATSIPFDGSDPLVVLLAWALTVAARKVAPKAWGPWMRKITPILAVLLAVFLRTAITAGQGEPLTAQVLLRALAAGATAVWGHSQVREFAKAQFEAKAEEPPSGEPPAPKP